MKKYSLVAALLSVFVSFYCFADSEGLKAVKRAPGVICAEDANKTACEGGVIALMKAVKTYASLNETCQAKENLRDELDEKTRYQCDTAKEVTSYLDGLQN